MLSRPYYASDVSRPCVCEWRSVTLGKLGGLVSDFSLSLSMMYV